MTSMISGLEISGWFPMQISEAITAGLKACFPDKAEQMGENPSMKDWLEKPPQPEVGDYAFPCFRLGKPIGKSPAVIAQTLADYLIETKPDWLKSAQVKGAFLNIFLSENIWYSHILKHIDDGSYFRSIKHRPQENRRRVMIEFSQPNTHKEFHVGHMRNVALGDSLVRLFRYCGFEVVPVNYIGDEGTHIAECLWNMARHGDDLNKIPYERRVEWLEERYAEAKSLMQETSDTESLKEYKTQVGQVHTALESGQAPYYDMWQTTRKWCLDHFDEIYKWLGVSFDHIFYESEMTEEGQSLVDEFLERGVFKKDAGAIGMDLEEEKLGFVIVRKSDGASLYATKDLALARRKFEKYKIDHSVYVVGMEQNLYFQQLFATLKHMGFEQAEKCFHLSYGWVKLPSGKMSTRKGNAIHLKLLQAALKEEFQNLMERYKGQWSDQELDDAIDKLSVGSIKFGMLATDPVRDIIFDMKNWISFEGNTGPYLMYSCARSQSILDKAIEHGVDPYFQPNSDVLGDEARGLIRYIQDLNDAVCGAVDSYKPSILVQHLYGMCKEFNRYYMHSSVLKAESPALASARLAVIKAFHLSLKKGLDLLGIEAPRKM